MEKLIPLTRKKSDVSGKNFSCGFFSHDDCNVDTPVLLITARDIRKLYNAFESAGIIEGQDYIQMLAKPFREGEFEKAVLKALHMDQAHTGGGKV